MRFLIFHFLIGLSFLAIAQDSIWEKSEKIILEQVLETIEIDQAVCISVINFEVNRSYLVRKTSNGLEAFSFINRHHADRVKIKRIRDKSLIKDLEYLFSLKDSIDEIEMDCDEQQDHFYPIVWTMIDNGVKVDRLEHQSNCIPKDIELRKMEWLYNRLIFADSTNN